MDRRNEKLETLFAAVRELPEAEQMAAVEALSEITNTPYELTLEEMTILRPALERAKQAGDGSEQDFVDLLDTPWVKASPQDK